MDWTLIYFGFAFFVLGLILDEILAKMKIPSYFTQIIKVHKVDWELFKVHYTLPPASGIQDILKLKIKNKIYFYPFSQKEIFFKEFQYDYGVSRYSVVPIHGSIELVNPQKVRITVCLNLAIPGVFFLFIAIFFTRFPSNVALFFIIILSAISGFWYYYLIKKRVKLLINTIDEWLSS